jgi:hypothetical protein
MQITVGNKKHLLQLLYWAPSHISNMSVLELNFLTAAHSQVRFYVGVKNICFEVFLMDSRMDTCHSVSTT